MLKTCITDWIVHQALHLNKIVFGKLLVVIFYFFSTFFLLVYFLLGFGILPRMTRCLALHDSLPCLAWLAALPRMTRALASNDSLATLVWLAALPRMTRWLDSLPCLAWLATLPRMTRCLASLACLAWLATSHICKAQNIIPVVKVLHIPWVLTHWQGRHPAGTANGGILIWIEDL